MRHDRIVSATAKRGVLLVAPNGANRTWDFWRAGSPDVAFARAVLDDIYEAEIGSLAPPPETAQGTDTL